MATKASMVREVVLTREVLDTVRLSAGPGRDALNGAIVCFQGVVRGSEAGKPIGGIHYTAFERMALHQFGLLLDAVESRWGVASVRLHHRLGPVPAGEVSLWVEVVAAHRGEAFAACQWLIDEMKRVVPIWKQSV
jgi:molybdopterin synthase catalytic subunit